MCFQPVAHGIIDPRLPAFACGFQTFEYIGVETNGGKDLGRGFFQVVRVG
jgi:hypothetical protein